jgi:hypothetical protein
LAKALSQAGASRLRLHASICKIAPNRVNTMRTSSFVAFGVGLLLCREPTEPTCIAFGMDLFPSSESLGVCETEVRSYIDESKRYIACLEEERDAALRRANVIVDEWNRRVRAGR